MSTKLFPVPGPWREHLSIIPRPRGGDWLEDEAGMWRQNGIDTVVSLLEPGEAEHFDLLAESKTAENNGIQFISFPIPDRGVPTSTSSAVSLMSEIASALEEGKHVALHCRQSIGRAGVIAAGVLIASGSNPGDALETVTAARWVVVPETAGQREWIGGPPLKTRVSSSR